MKTLIKTLFASSLALVLSSATVLAATTNENTKPMAATKSLSFKRIKVNGNVEVTLVQGSRTGVSYTDENSGRVKVMQNGDGLEIVSTDHTPAKITVYVNDLFRIQAADHARIKTEGVLNTKYLQVFLSGNASADLQSRSEGLYTVIENNADLVLSGSTGEHNLVMGASQKLTMNNFTAKTTKTSFNAENAVAVLSK